jgi:hypothetical protein
MPSGQEKDDKKPYGRCGLDTAGEIGVEAEERGGHGGEHESGNDDFDDLLHLRATSFFKRSIWLSIIAISPGMFICWGQWGRQRPQPVQWSARRSSSGTAFA